MRKIKSHLLKEPRVLPEWVDIGATIEKHGYDPQYLKKNSCRLVVVRCVECGEPRDKKMIYIAQKTCLACSNGINARGSRQVKSELMKAYYANGGKHPLKGVGHSLASREKMSEYQRNKGPVVLTEAGRQKLSETCQRVLNNPEMQARVKEINKKRCGPLSASYGKPPAHTKKVWHVSSNGKQTCFRSTWEHKFAVYLDEMGLIWEYEPKTFPVEYQLSDKVVQGTYTPDFLVSGKWYEVKGRWTMESLAKFEAFRETYPGERIIVIGRKWLMRKGLL